MIQVCGVCPRHCRLDDGQTGFCQARRNVGGSIRCVNYGRITSLSLDPIEKKPLQRFFPGSLILSAGSFGCNLRCPYCQNHDISMSGERAQAVLLSPEILVEKAAALADQGNIGIAYTYNEPLIGYEYVSDCALLTARHGLKNVIVTNGYVCPEPLHRLLPNIHAMNIDLKGFTERYYQWIGGDLQTVKDTIQAAVSACHVEITTLVVPGENDSEREMDALSSWLASLNADIPLHISRFFPRFQLADRQPTPVPVIYRLAETARRHLRYVYTGNC